MIPQLPPLQLPQNVDAMNTNQLLRTLLQVMQQYDANTQRGFANTQQGFAQLCWKFDSLSKEVSGLSDKIVELQHSRRGFCTVFIGSETINEFVGYVFRGA